MLSGGSGENFVEGVGVLWKKLLVCFICRHYYSGRVSWISLGEVVGCADHGAYAPAGVPTCIQGGGGSLPTSYRMKMPPGVNPVLSRARSYDSGTMRSMDQRDAADLSHTGLILHR